MIVMEDLKDEKSMMILQLLRLSENEGEDITLQELIPLICKRGKKIQNKLLKFTDLPPRVVIALLYLDPDWKKHVRKAAEKYLPELL